ncbi:MAG: hypothetical protein K2O04_02760 [Clostridiales bacterium]|nr:hypothetical protein [Clostridiales bacterium]
MSDVIKVKCIDCGREIEYDGRMIACPHCYMEFESDEISEWKKQLAAFSRAKTVDNAVADEHPSPQSPPPAQQGAAGANSRRMMPKSMPSMMPKSVSATMTRSVAGSAAQSHAPSAIAYEWRGERFNAGQEKDAFKFILRKGLIAEVIDVNGGVTETARRLLSAMGKSVPNLSMLSRERKFFRILYRTVFASDDLPLHVNDARIGLPMANNRAQLLQRIEANSYAGATFDLFGKRTSFAELARSGALCEYLGLDDEGREALCKRFEQDG